MKRKTVYNIHSKTYTNLLHTAWHLLDLAETEEKGSLLNLQAAMIFFSFSFEAYLNHVGEEDIPFWPEIERIPYSSKLSVLSKHLEFPIDKSQRPFQAITELFKFRNALAHGRTQRLQHTVLAEGEPDIGEAWCLLPEEQLSTKSVRRFHDDVKDAIEFINQHRKNKDDYLFEDGIRESETSRMD